MVLNCFSAVGHTYMYIPGFFASWTVLSKNLSRSDHIYFFGDECFLQGFFHIFNPMATRKIV